MCPTDEYAQFANALIDAFRARGLWLLSASDPEIEVIRLEALKRLLAREDTGAGLVPPNRDELNALSRVLDHIEKMDQERRRLMAIEQKHGEAGLQVDAVIRVAKEQEISATESGMDAKTEAIIVALQKIERKNAAASVEGD